MFTAATNQTYQSIDSIVKIYPTFIRRMKFSRPFDVQESGWISRTQTKKSQKTTEQSVERSLRRSKTTISDIILSNDFDMFITFTFKNNRQDISKCKSRMSSWINRTRVKYGSFHYIIVPEFHKDGESLHFHMLAAGMKAPLKDSGTKINGRTAYNLTTYTIGFNSVVKIDDKRKVSSYVKKYITKEMPQFNGKKRYWCSTGLIRSITLCNPVETKLFNETLLFNWEETFRTETLIISETSEMMNVPINKEILWLIQKQSWTKDLLQTSLMM